MGTKRNIRRWLLVLQTLLLILLALSGTLIVLLRLGNAEAAQTGELPEIGGFRYYIVAENAQPELPKGALLLLDPVRAQAGDLLLLSPGGRNPEDLLDGRYLPVRLTGSLRQFSGETLVSQSEIFFQGREIRGRVFQVLPGWGTVCLWMTEPTGGILFWGILALLTLAMGLLCLRISRSLKPKPTPALPQAPDIPSAETIHSQIRVLPGTTPPPPGRGGSGDPYAEVFRIEDPAPDFDPPDKLDLFAREQEAVPRPAPEPAFEAPPPPAPAPAPEPASDALLGDTIEFEPIRRESLPKEPEPVTSLEAPAPAEAAQAEPPEPLPEEPEALPAAPVDHESAAADEPQCPPAPEASHPHDPAGGAQEEPKAEALPEEPGVFDPDRIVAEIRQRNALFDSSLRNTPQREEAGPDRRRDHPASHRWRGVYRPGSGNGGAEEIIRAHQQDYAAQRFRPSFITVVGEIGRDEESPQILPGRFFSRDEQDGV